MLLLWQTVFEQKILGITCSEISLDNRHPDYLLLHEQSFTCSLFADWYGKFWKIINSMQHMPKEIWNKNILRQHLRYVHGEIKHRCNICDKEVRTCELNTHISINHAIAENYTCDIWEKKIQYQ